MAQVVSRQSFISELGFDPGPIRVGFVVDGGALGQGFFPEYLVFPLGGSSHQYLNVSVVDAV